MIRFHYGELHIIDDYGFFDHPGELQLNLLEIAEIIDNACTDEDQRSDLLRTLLRLARLLTPSPQQFDAISIADDDEADRQLIDSLPEPAPTEEENNTADENS